MDSSGDVGLSLAGSSRESAKFEPMWLTEDRGP